MYEASKVQMWIVFKSGCGSLLQVTVSPASGARKCVAESEHRAQGGHTAKREADDRKTQG